MDKLPWVMNMEIKKSAILFLTIAGMLSSRQLAEACEDNKIKVENVISMQVLGGLAATKPSPVYKNNTANGKEIITKVVAWINSSVPIGEQPDYGKHGYPRVLKIQLINEDPLYVQVGYKCVTSKSPPPGIFAPEGQDASFKSCYEVKDEIVISKPKLNLRAKSTPLYEWLKRWENSESTTGC
jgi:hypothetical protein